MNLRGAIVFASVGLLGLAGCAPNQPAQSGTGLLTGDWAGEHIALKLSSTGGDIKYDCGSGAINGPLRVSGGTFDATGIHVPGMPGPERMGEKVDTLPARYLGSITGDRMSLNVLLGSDTIGTYQLTRGQKPNLKLCL